MKTLTAALSDVAARAAGTCPLPGILTALPPDEAGVLTGHLANRRVPSVVIAIALGESGHPVGYAELRDHRNADCACVLGTP